MLLNYDISNDYNQNVGVNNHNADLARQSAVQSDTGDHMKRKVIYSKGLFAVCIALQIIKTAVEVISPLGFMFLVDSIVSGDRNGFGRYIIMILAAELTIVAVDLIRIYTTALGMAAYIQPKLLIGAPFVFILCLFIPKLHRSALEKAKTDEMEADRRFTNTLDEQLAGFDTIRSYGMSKRASDERHAHTRRVCRRSPYRSDVYERGHLHNSEDQFT